MIASLGMEPNTKVFVENASERVVTLARRYYERYIANSDGLNFRGEKCPPWPELTAAVQSHWCAVAEESIAAAAAGDLA